MFCQWPLYARAHIGFMYNNNRDILFVYPSHLGPWATFGGLEKAWVVGRVQDIFSGYWSWCVSWEVISNFMQYLHSLTKPKFPGTVWAFWWALAAMQNLPGVFHIAHHCMSLWLASFRCNFATCQDLSYALWVATLTFLYFFKSIKRK